MTESESPLIYQRLAELERRQKVAESLRGALAVLNSNLPVEKILAYIAQQARPLLGADAAAIYRLQFDGILSIQASSGLTSDYIEHANIPIGESATGEALLTQHPVFYENVDEISSHRPAASPNLARMIQRLGQDYRSVLAVPMMVRDESYGTLTLYYREPHAISEEEIVLTKDFSSQAALAIENTRLRLQIEQDAVTAERNRLARELHDSVTQNLFSASLIAEVLPTIWQRDPQQGMEGLQEIRQLTRGALAEMRSLLLELRPHALEEVRLEELLRQLVESVSGRIRKTVELEISGQALLSIDIRLAFYRIAQEALNNIVKHAEADQIRLSLTCANPDRSGQCQYAKMVITDDGCGFDNRRSAANHFGFSIMKERAQAVNASLTIESQINCGTQITMIWQAEEGKTP